MDQSQLDGRTIRVNESKPRGSEPRGSGPGGRGGFNASGKAEVKLYVGNLSFDTPADKVKGIFEKYGSVTDCFLPTDRETNRVRGFAFVTMPASDAENACSKVNGQELDGRTLRVNEAQPKGGGGGGHGGPPSRGGDYDRSGYGGYRGGGYEGGYGGYGGGGGAGGGYNEGYGRGGGGYSRGGYDDRSGGYGGGYGRGGHEERGGGYGGGGYSGGPSGGYNDGYSGGKYR